MLILTLVVFSSFIIKENSAGPNIGNAASIIDSVRKPVLSVDKIASMKTKEDGIDHIFVSLHRSCYLIFVEKNYEGSHTCRTFCRR